MGRSVFGLLEHEHAGMVKRSRGHRTLFPPAERDQGGLGVLSDFETDISTVDTTRQWNALTHRCIVGYRPTCVVLAQGLLGVY